VLGSGSSAVMAARGVGDLCAAASCALRQTLRLGGVDREAVGHVHAHGAATRRGDAEEARAIAEVFAGRTRPVPVTAVKSYCGNAGAACGVIEVIASLLACRARQLFPVRNYETPDRECPVEVVRSADVPAGEIFVNLNVTPLGQASALAVRTLPQETS
jgi:3-oxoacyl-[acyl-carrier-protein] synthase II